MAWIFFLKNVCWSFYVYTLVCVFGNSPITYFPLDWADICPEHLKAPMETWQHVFY